jgi:hypothetical protein
MPFSVQSFPTTIGSLQFTVRSSQFAVCSSQTGDSQLIGELVKRQPCQLPIANCKLVCQLQIDEQSIEKDYFYQYFAATL